MHLTLVTPSTDTPVSYEEAKEHLRLVGDAQAGSLVTKIKAATEYCEGRIFGHRSFMQATYDGVLDGFPVNNGQIEFPLPPLKQLTRIRYYNTSDTLTTYYSSGSTTSTAFDIVQPTHAPGFIKPKDTEDWPETRTRPDAVTIRFTAGYGSADDVPVAIKEAILLKTEELFDPSRVKGTDIDRAIDGLLSRYDYGAYA